MLRAMSRLATARNSGTRLASRMAIARTSWVLPASARRLCTASELQLDMQTEMDSRLDGELDPMRGTMSGLTDAIQLLLDQEDQGVAADRTTDLFVSSLLLDSKLYDSVLAYFVGHKDATPNTETYTSLIYVCVKLRQLDEAFKNFEDMVNQGILPESRTYAHLIKGCGRTKQVRRGEAFFRLLKQRNSPQVYDRRVYNAMINMYSHARSRGDFLTPAEAAPAWDIFDEMQARGIAADEVTYNSLISHCSRTIKPDVTRALSTLREMEAVGVPPTDVTLSALCSTLGRASNIELARSHLTQMLSTGTIRPTTVSWRPLLHAAAVAGDVRVTQSLFDEMVEHCGSQVFDSFRHRVTNAYNYVILAHGYAKGYEVAHAKFEEARARGWVDTLTYSFMLELALNVKRRLGKGLSTSPEGRALAVKLFEQMKSDGLTPSTTFCHKMFAVFAQSGELDTAEELFSQMQAASVDLKTSGERLARQWLDGDLVSIREALTSAPISSQSMCHNSMSYVRLIEACVLAGKSEKVDTYLGALREEAAAKSIHLGHEITSPLLSTFSRGGAHELDAALALHRESFQNGRPCPSSPSMQLCTALLKQGRLEDAARVLLEMAQPRRQQAWVYSSLAQRVAKLEVLVREAFPMDGAEPAAEQRERVEALLAQVRQRFEIEPAPPTEAEAPSAEAPAAAPQPELAAEVDVSSSPK